MIKKYLFVAFLTFSLSLFAQDYYYADYQPFDTSIPSPEEYLGYRLGDYHTRHDLVVAYLYKLAELSDNATVSVYG